MNNNLNKSTRQVTGAKTDPPVLHTKWIALEKLPVAGHDLQIQRFYRASKLAVIGYQSARHGCEVCFGLLPEAYD